MFNLGFGKFIWLKGHVGEQPADGTYTFKNDGELKFCLVLFSGDLGNWSLKSSYSLLLFTLAFFFYFNVGWGTHNNFCCGDFCSWSS